MKSVNRKILEQVIAASADPVMIVRLDRTDWPVVGRIIAAWVVTLPMGLLLAYAIASSMSS